MIGKMFGEYGAKFASLKTLYGWLYGQPGKKLLFMGQEFAQFIEWDYRKELDWFLLAYGAHAGMREWVRALNGLYREHGALYARDDGWDGFQWLNVDDVKNNVFAFMRSDGRERVVCVYNFSADDFSEYCVALPEKGRLTLLLSSGERRFCGEEEGASPVPKKSVRTRNKGLNGLPCSGALVLPKNAALFYGYFV